MAQHQKESDFIDVHVPGAAAMDWLSVGLMENIGLLVYLPGTHLLLSAGFMDGWVSGFVGLTIVCL